MGQPPPRRNRVTPSGEIVPIDVRGAWTGNRGILHRGGGDDARIVRQHAGIAWITCVLDFRGRRIPQWAPGHYTPLFFPDEAVAFAAGHRPCAECRRPAFRAFLDALAAAGPDGDPDERLPVPNRAPDLDRLLDRQRRYPRSSRRRLHDRPWRELPDGTFVVLGDEPAVVIGDAVIGWTVDGYGPAQVRPARGAARLLTPPATVRALAAGYPVQIDRRARSSAHQARSSTDGSSSATDR
ncbi:hypothetical protein [Nakamurella sp.]|uniref:hypothetical protein n=1 Tax=Nakamurella sp. TaxID=1869182 RepID=UPI003783D562